MSNQLEKVKELIELRAQARLGGGEKAIEKQHAKGKYTARERMLKVNIQHVNVSLCCLTKVASKNWICS